MTGEAVYAGCFDPPTLGHQWVIDAATKILGAPPVVAVAVNPAKPARFSFATRIAMLRGMTTGPVVQIQADRLLVDWARQNGIETVVRGIRNVADFEYEAAMSAINLDAAPDVRTMFLVPPRELREVSSSLVMSLVGLEGWEALVSKYVTPGVMQELRRRDR